MDLLTLVRDDAQETVLVLWLGMGGDKGTFALAAYQNIFGPELADS